MVTETEQIAKLIAETTELKAYFEGVQANITRTMDAKLAEADAARAALQKEYDIFKSEVHKDMDAKLAEADAARAALQQEYDDFKANMAARLPVTPNLLSDTKHFSKLCGGKTNEAIEIIAAHSAPWSTYWYKGSTGSGTMTVVTHDQFNAHGIDYGGDMALAVNSDLYGIDFRVLLLDVTITGDRSDGEAGRLYMLNQGCPKYTGWHTGEFITETSLLFNVVEQSGDIVFYPHCNMPAPVKIDGNDNRKGWLYRQATRVGWGGCHQPIFVGKGHMKVAIALPYIGFGDHGGKFVWAGSIGPHGARYSHHDIITS